MNDFGEKIAIETLCLIGLQNIEFSDLMEITERVRAETLKPFLDIYREIAHSRPSDAKGPEDMLHSIMNKLKILVGDVDE